MDGTMVILRLGMSVQLEYDKLSKSASIFPST
jgi:hypothetical protein